MKAEKQMCKCNVVPMKKKAQMVVIRTRTDGEVLICNDDRRLEMNADK